MNNSIKKILAGVKIFAVVAVIAIMVGGCCQHCGMSNGDCCAKHKEKPCEKMAAETDCSHK